ncbi:hypothetical protein K0U07_01745 [bacterium]|nr:hypothetical protein [bacterium]
MRVFIIFVCCLMGTLFAEGGIEVDVVSYDKLFSRDEKTILTIKKALLEKGVVAVRGIPHFMETKEQFIKAAREFEALPEAQKACLVPDRLSGDQLGYEAGGVEKFQREDGSWVVDDVKASYYAIVPFDANNKWPKEVDLKGPYLAMGSLIRDTGRLLMQAVSLIQEGAYTRHVGRMLHYKKSKDMSNPQWCGMHFDHGLFTGLIPPVYYKDGKGLRSLKKLVCMLVLEKMLLFKRCFCLVMM